MLNSPRVAAIVTAAVVASAAVGLAGADAALPPASAPPSPSPSRMHGWTRVFEEDFDRDAPLGDFASAYPGWAAYDGTTDTSRTVGRPAAEQGVYDSATTTTVHDGMWDCRVHSDGGRPQVCAMTPTPDGSWWRGQKYGRYTVRFHADPVPGYKIAWLLWPNTNRWADGEIDFPEGSLDGTITGSSHQVGDPQNNAFLVNTGQPVAGWHTATIEWRPSGLIFDLDGRTWQTTGRSGAMPSIPMFWALQVETDLTVAPPPRDASGHVLVDRVTVDAWND